MRSIFLIAMSIIVGTATAQNSYVWSSTEKNHFQNVSEKIKSGPTPKSGANVILESDFSDFSEWITQGAFGSTWIQSFDGPQGTFSIGPIASTTADNGFALYDSDFNCIDQDNARLQYATPLDLSGVASADVTFETYYRQFQGQCLFQYSVNGGENWVTTFLFSDLSVNQSTPNPLVLTIPNALPGGFDEVLFRFRYVGSCDYSWMIDDLVITESASFNLALTDFFYDEYILLENEISPQSVVVENFEYTDYRTNQVRPLTFIGEIENQGVDTLTNVTMTVTLTTPNGTEVFVSDPLPTLLSGDRETLVIEDVFPAAFESGGAIGNYSVQAVVNADEEELSMADNTLAAKEFSVNEEFQGNFSDRSGPSDLAYLSLGFNDGDQFYGSVFTLENAAAVNYIEFAYGNPFSPSFVPTEVFLNIRRGSVIEDPSESDSLYFGQMEVGYTILEEDLTTDSLKMIRVYLPQTVTLDAGFVYQAELFRVFAPDLDGEVTLVRPSETTAGTFIDLNSPSSGPQGWFILGESVPAIRTGFDGLVQSPILITQQPESVLNACLGQSVVFEVAGENIDSFQWQQRNDPDGDWFDISGATESTLVISFVDFTAEGTFYRCRLSNSSEEVFSELALLTLDNQPPDIIVNSTLPFAIASTDECGLGVIPVVTGEDFISFSDFCTSSEDLLVVQSPEAGAATDSSGTVSVTVFDAEGNFTSVDLSYTVEDTLPPVPDSSLLSTVILNCGDALTSIPTATDNCSGTVFGQTDDDLNFTAEGEFTVVWNYFDESGNEANQTQTVLVQGGDCCNASSIVLLTLDTIRLTEPVCPGVTIAARVRQPGTVAIPSGGGYALRFSPADSADQEYIVVINQATYLFDNTLNGMVQSGLEGLYFVSGFVFTDIEDPAGSVCDEVGRGRPYAVISSENAICTAGIDQNQLYDLVVFPNPATTEISFTNDFKGRIVTEVFDAQGRKVLESIDTGNQRIKSLNVSTLASGIYSIRSTGEQGISVGHFLKE